MGLMTRPAAARRSRTSAEEKTRTNALAAPPVKRRLKNADIDDGKPTIPVERALSAKAPRNQTRRPPGRAAREAAKAPKR